MYRLNFCGIYINIKKIMKLELCFLAVLDKVYHTPYGAIGSKTKDGSIIFYFDNKHLQSLYYINNYVLEIEWKLQLVVLL